MATPHLQILRPPPEPKPRPVLMNRSFLLLWLAQLISQSAQNKPCGAADIQHGSGRRKSCGNACVSCPCGDQQFFFIQIIIVARAAAFKVFVAVGLC